MGAYVLILSSKDDYNLQSLVLCLSIDLLVLWEEDYMNSVFW
jgi:hypothetical protein